MKRVCFILPFLLAFHFGYSQKSLSKAAIQDFATNFYWNYRYGSDFFKATIFRVLGANHGIVEISILMEKLGTDVKGREELFKGLYHHVGNAFNNDFLFQNLYSTGISAVHAKEIADYIFSKYSKVTVGRDKLKSDHAVKVETIDYEKEKNDSLRRISDSLNIQLKKEDEANERLFLRDVPNLDTAINFIGKPKDSIVNYLIHKGYKFFKHIKNEDIYLKGDVADSVSARVYLDGKKLKAFSFTSWKDNCDNNEIERKFKSLGFEGTFDNIRADLKNKKRKLKSIITIAPRKMSCLMEFLIFDYTFF